MFRKSFTALCAIIVLALPFGAQGATLTDSVTSALQGHPQITAKKAAVDAAQDAVREQKSVFFPVVGVNGRFGRSRENTDTTRAFTGGAATSWVGEGNVVVTEPVFAGFSNVNRLEAARDRAHAAQYDYVGSTDDVAMRAARAHLNLMRTRELLNDARRYMDSIQGRKNSIDLMVKEGAADKSELLQAQELLMAARNTRFGYEESFRQAEADYIAVTGGLPPKTLEFGPPAWDRLIPRTVEQAIAEAVAGNPLLKSADSLVSALGNEADATRGTLIPRLDAEVSATRRDQHEELGGELENMQGMMRLSWNFATGGGQIARVDRDRSAQREAFARRDDLLRTVEHDVRQRFTSMLIVDQQFDLLRERERTGESLLNNLTSQYEGGKQTNLQLIYANSRLFDARAARTDAYYRRLLARFELLNAMGKLRAALAPETVILTPAKVAPPRVTAVKLAPPPVANPAPVAGKH
jgi:outer membrane protein TolC